MPAQDETLKDMLRKLVQAVTISTNGKLDRNHFGKLEITGHIEAGKCTGITVAGRRFRKEDLESGY